MKHNRHRKQCADRRRMEIGLVHGLRQITARGSFLNDCMKKDAKTQKYGIAKKRYLALFDDAEKMLKQIKNSIELMEKDSIKEQIKEKLRDVDDKRNKKIRGEEDEEEETY